MPFHLRLHTSLNRATMYGIEGLLAGRTLADRYLINEVIGRGGMGAVYRARDLRLGREVAVKVISVAVLDAEAHGRLRARFQREARAAASLHHPNVVQVYDYGTDAVLGLDFFVMELLRGEDLSQRLSSKGVPAVPTALQILLQASRGLAAGHRAGMIHRDVKPGNLFLEPGDQVGEVHVKVLDFGIAEVARSDEATATHLTLGRSPFSPAYASPEQLRGDDRVSPASDVFSLGAVGFHLLTGRRAFQTSDWREMLVELSRSVATELPRVRGLPAGAHRALQRALSPEPRDRFPDAAAFAEALAPLSAEPTGVEDERTLLAEEERAETFRWTPPPTHAVGGGEPTRGTRFLDPPMRSSAPDPRVLAGLAEAAGGAAPVRVPPQQPAPARGWLRRAARATWNFLVTAAAVGSFAATWFLCVTGLQDGDLSTIYLATAASVVLAPLAIHRLMDGRGSLRLALLGSVTGSVGAVLLLGRGHEMAAVLSVVFVAQVSLSLLAEWMTSRREPEDDL